MALRFAFRACLIGLLAVWLAAPSAGALAAADTWARVAITPISSFAPDAFVKPDTDPEPALAGLLCIPWAGEDDETPKALAFSSGLTPLGGIDPNKNVGGARWAQISPFLRPFKTGPPIV